MVHPPATGKVAPIWAVPRPSPSKTTEPGTGVPSIALVSVPEGHQLLMSTELTVSAKLTR